MNETKIVIATTPEMVEFAKYAFAFQAFFMLVALGFFCIVAYKVFKGWK